VPTHLHLHTSLAREDSIIETILVVDPARDVLDLIRDILESRGYIVQATTDSAAALTRLDGHDGPVDLLIVDVVTPVLRGRELAAVARERHPEIPQVLLTGHPIETLAEYAPLPPGVLLLAKPFTVESMLEAVRRALR
jgi:CheY-like chemotaxis protein